MSSFVIGKKEYIKAAGLTAGLAKAFELWQYDFINHRNMTKEDYYNFFSECFTMNALSVAEQYRDAESETNSNDYMTDFNKYYKYGSMIRISSPDKINKTVLELNQFYRSAMYQTEKEVYMFKMQMRFNSIITELFEKINSRYELESWGTLEIEM